MRADCLDRNPLRQPYFGDTHVHTIRSLDAQFQGTIVTPDLAYRYAKGEKIPILPYDDNGQPLRYSQLTRPLDFAVITDHAEVFW